MKYQIESQNAPFVERDLRHGLLIKGERKKTVRVRMSFAQDKRNLKNSNTNDQNLEYLAKLVTIVGAETNTTFEMMTCLSENDLATLWEMSAEADKLDIEDPKLSDN